MFNPLSLKCLVFLDLASMFSVAYGKDWTLFCLRSRQWCVFTALGPLLHYLLAQRTLSFVSRVNVIQIWEALAKMSLVSDLLQVSKCSFCQNFLPPYFWWKNVQGHININTLCLFCLYFDVMEVSGFLFLSVLVCPCKTSVSSTDTVGSHTDMLW